jgi:NADPH-dependent curcumin reductase CurA
VIDYKATGDSAAALTAALAEAAPEGIDVYFDNVGGGHLEAALNAARPYARFAICGMISMYNAEAPVPGPANMALIIGKNLRLEGFIVSNHWDMMGDFLKELGAWHAQGQLKWRQTVREGIASAPDAFIGLFTGANMGKMLVKLA